MILTLSSNKNVINSRSHIMPACLVVHLRCSLTWSASLEKLYFSPCLMTGVASIVSKMADLGLDPGWLI